MSASQPFSMLIHCGRRCVPPTLSCLQRRFPSPSASAYLRRHDCPSYVRSPDWPSTQIRCIANAGHSNGNAQASSARETDPKLDELQALVQSDTTSAEDLLAVLLRTKDGLSRLNLTARRAECKRLQLGGKVLLWLWNKRQDSGSSQVLDEEFADVLTWFLLPEGNEAHVWEWIHTEIALLAGQEYGDRQGGPMRWSLRLLGGLAQAHCEWADKGSPDPAILCLNRAVETLPRDHTGRRVFVVGMYVVLSRHIMRSPCPVHSAVLFEWFYRNLRHGYGDRYRLEQREARLPVWHPTKPKALPLVGWILGDWPDNQIWQAKQSALTSLGKDLLRASYILRHQGRTSQADGIDLIIQRKIPAVWADRTRLEWLKGYENDRRLDSVRQYSA